MGYWDLSLSEGVAKNQKLRCTVPGCGSNRYKLSKLCEVHLNNRRRTGHVHGSLFSKKSFENEISEASDIILLNRSHILVRDSLLFLRRWFDDSMRGVKGTPAIKSMAQIAERGAEPLDIFEMVSGMTLDYSRTNTRFKDALSWQVNMGYRVVRYFPLRTMPKRREYYKVGEIIRKQLGQAMMMITKAADKRELQRRTKEKEKRVEFVIE
jgi:hypothetical protein